MKDFTIRYKIISFLKDIDVIGIRFIVNSIPKILIPKPTKKLVIKTMYGFDMEVDPVKDNGVEKSIYYTGTYEKGTLHVIKNSLPKGGVFVDVGANIGLMSVFASFIVGEVGKVFSFEPNPNTFDIFKRNIELNGISNIETSHYAIGSVPETTKIYDHWHSNRGSSSLIEPDYKTDFYNIEVVTLSDFFKDNEQKINLLKFDIEGYELEALKGSKELIEKNYPVLIIECSDKRENFDDSNNKTIFNFVKSTKKYRVFKLSGSKERVSKLVEIITFNDVPEHDNIFCFTQAHLENISSDLFKTSPL